MKYTVEYFINKFKHIPRSKWCEGEYEFNGRHCALGHCGATKSGGEGPREATALIQLFRIHSQSVVSVNDARLGTRFHQKTPKSRILAALRSFK